MFAIQMLGKKIKPGSNQETFLSWRKYQKYSFGSLDLVFWSPKDVLFWIPGQKDELLCTLGLLGFKLPVVCKDLSISFQ